MDRDDCLTCRYMCTKYFRPRGIMDCDPPESYCSCNQDYFDGDREYNEDGEELGCEHYAEREY